MRKALFAVLAVPIAFAVFSAVYTPIDAQSYRGRVVSNGADRGIFDAARMGFLVKPSPDAGLWGSFPSVNYADPGVAFGIFEDFVQVNTDDQSPYRIIGWYSSSDSTGLAELEPLADFTGGAVSLTIAEGAANLGAIMKLTDKNQASSEPYRINTRSGQRAWIAMRFRVVNTDSLSFAFGLARKDATWDSLFNDTKGELGVNFVGFKTDMVAPTTSVDSLNFSYKSGAKIVENNVGIINANTWYVAGFYFDGSRTVTPYFNGVAGRTANVDNDAFPRENLTLVVSGKKLTAKKRTLDIDWIKAYQLR